jgi:threonine dehydrogenase-like Zn-dependent dehydrogenase
MFPELSDGNFRSALMMGAGRVIAIDEVAERLAMAEGGGAESTDFSKSDVYEHSWRARTSSASTAASTRLVAKQQNTARQRPSR